VEEIELRPPKVVLISSQPIQNAASLQAMASDSRVDIMTVYCSLPDPKLWRDPEHLTKDAFDLPLLEGYSWVHARNYSPFPRLGKFYGLINPGVIKQVSRADCCIVYGHAYISFWLAIAAAKLLGKPVLIGTDATSWQTQSGANWKISLKASLKKKLFPFFYKRIASLVLVPSTNSRRFICSMGVSEERVILTPYVVDNESIAARATQTDKEKIRKEWMIPEDASVVLFCAKFLERKRPHDAVRAFAEANVSNSYLVMVGDGPLAESVKSEARRLGIIDRVRFTGLVKYSRLLEFYASSDVLLFPSEREPYGLPVNEAMICGIPAIVSDRIGAGYDLVSDGETGFVYRCGDVSALAKILSDVLPDRLLLKSMGERASKRMTSWSPGDNAEATIRAVEKAIGNLRLAVTA